MQVLRNMMDALTGAKCIVASTALVLAFLAYRRNRSRDFAGRLDGYTVLVTGASQGLGRQLAKDFFIAGAKVILAGRNSQSLNDAVLCILEETGNESHKQKRIFTFEFDVSNTREMASSIDTFVRSHPNAGLHEVDIVVNNAGVSQRGDFMTMTIDKDRKIFDVNYFGAVQLTRLLMKYLMRGNNAPVLVNICSVQSWIAMPGRCSYSASKFALRCFGDALRVEMGNKLRVLSVYPGYITTSIDQNAVFGDNFVEEEQMCGCTHLKEIRLAILNSINLKT